MERSRVAALEIGQGAEARPQPNKLMHAFSEGVAVLCEGSGEDQDEAHAWRFLGGVSEYIIL